MGDACRWTSRFIFKGVVCRFHEFPRDRGLPSPCNLRIPGRQGPYSWVPTARTMAWGSRKCRKAANPLCLGVWFLYQAMVHGEVVDWFGWLVGWWKWRFGLLFCNWIHSLWYFWWFEICNSIFGPLFYIWIGHWWILRIFSYWREFRRMVFVKRNDIDVSWWWNVSWTDQENNFFVGRWEDHGGQPFGEFEDSILRIDGGGWNEHLEELVKLL